MLKRILLFIPMYTCQKQLCLVLGQLDKDALNYITKVIIVDSYIPDNSDQSVEGYLQEHPDIPAMLVRYEHNHGKVGAEKVALNYAIENGFEYMISLQCDGLVDIHDILSDLQEGMYQQFDEGVGTSTSNGSKFIGCSQSGNIGNRVHNLISTDPGRTTSQLDSSIAIYKVEPIKSGERLIDACGECAFDVIYETKKNAKKKPKVFVLDVDGVLTDGGFYYTVDGKVAKKFGADDNDALSLLRPYLEIIFVTGDKRGFNISKKRIEDMHFRLELVSTIKRIDWIRERYDPQEVIYMGDGIFDHYVMREVGYGISTSDGDDHAKKYADYVTVRTGGHRAVAEACLHIMDKFFVPYNEKLLPAENINFARDWTV